jgi:hypothetical protein
MELKISVANYHTYLEIESRERSHRRKVVMLCKDMFYILACILPHVGHVENRLGKTTRTGNKRGS